jgi:hypothetical protein
MLIRKIKTSVGVAIWGAGMLAVMADLAQSY